MTWAGIISSELVGPFQMDNGFKMIFRNYCKFLEDTIPKQWYQKKPASFKRSMILLQDNALSHVSKCTRDFLASRDKNNNNKMMTWGPLLT